LVYGRTRTAEVGVGPRELDLIEEGRGRGKEREGEGEGEIDGEEDVCERERLQLGVTVPCRSEGI